MIKQIIIALCSAASIVGLAFVNNMPFLLRLLIVVVGIICLVILIYDGYKQNLKNETVCKSDEEIKAVMNRLISTRGKICVVSRDLTWVDDEIKKVIKSKRDSMLIFAQNASQLTEELKKAGVIVKYYGKLHFEPKTRFTVVRYNRQNPQVAISNTQDSVHGKVAFRHTIYETSDSGSYQDAWINSLALDMINLFDKVSEE